MSKEITKSKYEIDWLLPLNYQLAALCPRDTIK